MATNFEFYKDEILEKTKGNSAISMVNGKLASCDATSCAMCDFNPECNTRFMQWLYAEHIDAPKLTKRERAFCEAVQTGWIARDKDRKIYWFPADEEIQKTEMMWNAETFMNVSITKLAFAFVKWEDEKPWSVEDLLKLEVKE